MQKIADSGNAQRIANWRSRACPAMRRVAVNERGHRIGADHPRSTIPDWAIELMLELRDAGLSYAAIAAKFDDSEGDGFTVSKSQVFKVCQGLVRAQVAVAMRAVKE